MCVYVQVREGELATAEGVSYLEAKHLLLLHYCTAIVFYLLLKAEGRPVQAHPVINRLVEARAYLVRCCGVGLPQLCECCAAAAAKAHCGALCAARLHRSGPAGSWC